MAGYFFKRHFFTGRLKAFEISDTCRHLPPQVLISLIRRNLGRSVGGGAWRFFVIRVTFGRRSTTRSTITFQVFRSFHTQRLGETRGSERIGEIERSL